MRTLFTIRTYPALLIISILTLAISSLILSSCKEDEPPTKPKLSFSEATKTINEADGKIEIKIKLDKGAFEDVTIAYELSGTALDKVTAGTTKSTAESAGNADSAKTGNSEAN